jgi:D-alanyl-D-alanine carboxypeptidase/D-alanyl-D-alanine-endopeptidase (penicillin-binding protein 4)
MHDPRLQPGRALSHALSRAGVELRGKVKLGGVSEKRRITYIASAPLSALLHRVGKYSDNFYAETIFKSLAVEEDGPPATSSGGAKRVLSWLSERKMDSKSIKVVNGSGLFDANRLTAELLVRVLASAHADPAVGPEFLSQLAIGGVDGTLAARFRGAQQRARVRAKTGTLDDVDVLVGYVLRTSGRAPVAFAVLINGIKRQHPAVRREIDRAVASLVDDG